MIAYILTLIDEESDKEFFISLYEKYQNQMMFEAKKVLIESQLSEDAVQNAFISIAKRIDTVRGLEEKAVRSYLLKSSRNAAIDILKKVKKEVCVNNVYNIKEDIAFDEINSLAEKSFINYILNELPEKYRNILYYHFVFGIPEKEIAQMLDMNINTVRQQVSRGRKKFIESYNKEMETV